MAVLVVTASRGAPLRVRLDVDDPLVRAAIGLLLQEAGAEVASTDDTLADLDLVAGPAERVHEGALVLVADADQARTAWAAGARGLLPRDVDGPTLLAALVAVAQGAVVLDASLAGELIPAAVAVDEAAALTGREQEVLALLAEGLPNKLIADQLGITERTARYHVAQILAKLGVQSRTEAVVQAARLGLIAL
ncbi:MAG: response regulator transcription factor [Bacteroidota bacterium]